MKKEYICIICKKRTIDKIDKINKRKNYICGKCWKNNSDVKERVANKISELHTNIEYQKRVHGSIYKGFIVLNKFGKIRFDSLLKLNYLIQADNNDDIKTLVRWTNGIKYLYNNKTHNCYPDFFVNGNLVVEVKSKYHYYKNNLCILAKIDAFKNTFPNIQYKLIFDDEILINKSNIICNRNLNKIINLNYDISFINKKMQKRVFGDNNEIEK